MIDWWHCLGRKRSSPSFHFCLSWLGLTVLRVVVWCTALELAWFWTRGVSNTELISFTRGLNEQLLSLCVSDKSSLLARSSRRRRKDTNTWQQRQTAEGISSDRQSINDLSKINCPVFWQSIVPLLNKNVQNLLVSFLWTQWFAVLSFDTFIFYLCVFFYTL